MKKINFKNWSIESSGGLFTATDGNICILFTAEYKKGCYSKIQSIYNGKRIYKAQKYHYKFIPFVSDITFELLKNGMLWDYENGVPALKTYKKDIEPYYKECKKKGLSLYNDTEFLNSLFDENNDIIFGEIKSKNL